MRAAADAIRSSACTAASGHGVAPGAAVGWRRLPGRLLESPRDYEWLEVTRAWREGTPADTWFVADPRRTDLALFDGASRASARVSLAVRQRASIVGGARPDELDWHICQHARLVSRARLGADAGDRGHHRARRLGSAPPAEHRLDPAPERDGAADDRRPPSWRPGDPPAAITVDASTAARSRRSTSVRDSSWSS